MKRWPVLSLLACIGFGSTQQADIEATLAKEEKAVVASLRKGLPPLACQESIHGFTGPYALGKYSLLLFWAPWCGPCKPVMDELVHLSGAGDVSVATVSQGRFEASIENDPYGLEGIRRMLEAHKLASPTCVYDDPAQRKAWNAEGIPKLVLFGPTGYVEEVAAGGDHGVALVARMRSGWRPSRP